MTIVSLNSAKHKTKQNNVAVLYEYMDGLTKLKFI